MSIRVGIPRSLFYYRFISFWETFFSELGAEVIVSEPTNKRILDDGVKTCVDEACLPVKLFHGHAINLMNRVDYLLVPRFTSISHGEYICPEFGGLPDMLRFALKGLPELLDTEINMRKSDKGAIKATIEMGERLGAGKHEVKAAYRTAACSLRRFKCQELCGMIPYLGDVSSSFRYRNGQNGKKMGDVDRLSNIEKNVPRGEGERNIPGDGRMKIAVIGHPYNIYDPYISMNIVEKLRKYGADVTTIEMIKTDDINKQASRLNKPMFWNYGRSAYGAAVHMAASGEINGIICVASFGCGIDSFVNDLIERKIRREYRIPLITITIDEHSGEAGFNTRLEAFIDMLNWRRLNENNVSSFG